MTAPRPVEDLPTIRDAAVGDISRIADIYAHYVDTSVATFEEAAPDTMEIAMRFERLSAIGLPWLVIEDSGGVQGYAYAAPFRDRSAYRFTVEDSIYIASDRLRRGYGALLLAELIARCEALGKRQMIAVVGGSESTASISLHSQMGFRVAGVLPSAGFKFGAWADSVMMTRTLGDGDASLPRDPD